MNILWESNNFSVQVFSQEDKWIQKVSPGFTTLWNASFNKHKADWINISAVKNNALTQLIQLQV